MNWFGFWIVLHLLIIIYYMPINAEISDASKILQYLDEAKMNKMQRNHSFQSHNEDLESVKNYLKMEPNGRKKQCPGYVNVQMMGRVHDSYETLKDDFAGKNCTHIVGSLILAHIRKNQSLDFLDDIEYISGALFIFVNSAVRISLRNLKVIRGNDYLKLGDKKFSLIITENKDLLELSLPSLQSIQNHNVLVENVPQLCHVPYAIHWPSIFERPYQRVWIKESNVCWPRIRNLQKNLRQGKSQYEISSDLVSKNLTLIELRQLVIRCSSDCPRIQATPQCWSILKSDCQILSKCKKRKCSGSNHCFTSELTHEEECCHPECTVGCFSSGPEHCYDCRNYYENDTCVATCPPYHIYSSRDYSLVRNPDFLLKMGNQCVKKCPVGFFENRDNCVRECLRPNGHVKDGKCVECKQAICPKVCKAKDIYPDPKVDHLQRMNIQLLANCTQFDGDIQIKSFSFIGDPHSGHSREDYALRWEDMFYLENLKTINGMLYIYSTTNGPWLKNLTFFKHLEEVEKISIVNSKDLQFLGFPRLKTVAESLLLFGNDKLCYANFNFASKSTLLNNKGREECEQEGHICDRNCYDKDSCWGPGPTFCTRCREFSVETDSQRLCVTNCSAIPGFTEPKSGNKCIRCHAECLPSEMGTCFREGSDQCVQGCHHVKDGPFCKDECPSSKFANSQGECVPCPSACSSSIRSPQKPVCFSERPILNSLKGCVLCRDVVLSPDSWQIEKCRDITNETCPEGTYEQIINLDTPWSFPDSERFYYNEHAQASFSNWVVNHTELTFYTGRVCLPCHEQCSVCSDNTNQCSHCRNYRLDNRCVSFCPVYPDSEVDDTNSTVETSPSPLDNTTNCITCHVECKQSCSGNSSYDCSKCKHFKIYLDSSRTAWNCSPDCPDKAPYKVFDNATRDWLCSATESSQMIRKRHQWVISVSMVTTVSILIFISLLTFYLHRKNRKQKELYERNSKMIAMQEIDRFIKQERPNSEVPPNMSTLQIIPECELEKGSIIGSGAFGTVYRGKWNTANKNLINVNAKSNDEGRVIVAVAIKVLSDTSNPATNQELLDETQVMATVHHSCCLRVFGLCMTERPQLVTQFMPLGCLLDYVRVNQPAISSQMMLCWSIQIADGMGYLESRGIIHRDLAARNVLVETPSQIRITDFGLAKILDRNEIKFQAKGGKMPIKWLAMESITFHIFSHKSDVWAYGVTLWEIFTFGQRPYQSIPANDLLNYLEQGGRLHQPDICSLDVYMILVKCWLKDADSRPSFEELGENFRVMLNESGRFLKIKSLLTKSQILNHSKCQQPYRGALSTIDTTDTSDTTDLTTLCQDDANTIYPHSQLLSLSSAEISQDLSYYSALGLPYGFLNRLSSNSLKQDVDDVYVPPDADHFSNAPKANTSDPQDVTFETMISQYIQESQDGYLLPNESHLTADTSKEGFEEKLKSHNRLNYMEAMSKVNASRDNSTTPLLNQESNLSQNHTASEHSNPSSNSSTPHDGYLNTNQPQYKRDPLNMISSPRYCEDPSMNPLLAGATDPVESADHDFENESNSEDAEMPSQVFNAIYLNTK